MKKLLITSTFAMAVLLCAAAQSFAATVNLAPTDDAYVHSGNANTNYGFSSALYVGDENWNAPAIMTRSYLKFPLSTIPAGSTINSAKMVLHINQIGNPPSMQVDAHFVSDDSWSETTVTWATAPAFNSAVSDSQVVSNGAQKVWKWDVTSEVIAELSGNTVITVMIRDPGEIIQGQFSGFISKDAVHPVTDFPYLEVDYDDGTQTVLKWSQPPVLNPESPYPDCFWGWDEVSIYGPSSSIGLWFPAWACATQCHGDADCDGIVSVNDMVILNAAMGSVYPGITYDPRADFDRDGDVDNNDLAILTSYWGTQPPPDCATSPSQQHIVADDWLCKTNQPVTDVHWWGSYEGYRDDVPPLGPDFFHIGIWTDVPAGIDQEWSHPEKMIWEWWVPRAELNETYVGCDYHPEHMQDIDSCFRYDFIIPEDQWFYQEDPNTIYWISIAAFYPDGTTEMFPWGWKTRPHYFNDDAVRIFVPTDPVVGSVFEAGEPIEDEAGNSWDMAFELTTKEEIPPPEREYGDAPEGVNALAYPSMGVVGNFPTCKTIGPAGYIEHNNFGAFFGPTFDFEADGNAGLCPSGTCFPPYDQDECFQDGDAGLLVPEAYTIDAALNVVTCSGNPGTALGGTCGTATWGANIDIHVTNNMPSNTIGYVNVLVDWDQNGSWGGSSSCPSGAVPEHVLVDFPIPNPYSGPLSGLMAAGTGFTIGPNSGYVWIRFSITERPVAAAGMAWDGSGIFEDGETEDYLLEVTSAPPDEKLKFQQLPLDGAMIRQTAYYGHDEVSTVYPYFGDPGPVPMIERYLGCYMADDFADYEHSPIVRVKWWGSYLGNEWIQPVNSFIIAFESDFPEPPSHPLELLQFEEVMRDMDGVLTAGEFTEVAISGGGAPCYETLYEYEAILANPFPQDPNTVYWLKIVAVVDLPPDHTFFQDPRTNPDQICDFLNYNYDPQFYDVTRWGWHNRDYTVMDRYAATPPAVVPGEHVQGNIPDGTADGVDVWHFQDDSVTGPVQMWVDADDPAVPKIVEIEQLDWLEQFYKYFLEQCGEGVDGPDEIEQYSKDLAFELWTPTQCVKPTAPFYPDWVAFNKPGCWCYKKNCKGNAEGAQADKVGKWYIGTEDLNILLAAWQRYEATNSIKGVTYTGLNGTTELICADYDHLAQSDKVGSWRVGTQDLNILLASWQIYDPGVPDCPLDWEGYWFGGSTGDGINDYYFLTTP